MSRALTDTGFWLSLDGEDWELAFTPRAHAEIDRRFGGFAAAHRAVDHAVRDVQAMVDVIRLGSGCGAEKAKALPAAVFRHGSVRLSPDLRDYLWRLEFGGQPLTEIAAWLKGRAAAAAPDDEASSEGN